MPCFGGTVVASPSPGGAAAGDADDQDGAGDREDIPAPPGDGDATTLPPKHGTRLRRRTRQKDDDYNFSDLRDPD